MFLANGIACRLVRKRVNSLPGNKDIQNLGKQFASGFDLRSCGESNDLAGSAFQMQIALPIAPGVETGVEAKPATSIGEVFPARKFEEKTTDIARRDFQSIRIGNDRFAFRGGFPCRNANGIFANHSRKPEAAERCGTEKYYLPQVRRALFLPDRS